MKATYSRKGFFFTFDALIAISILLVAFVIVSGIKPAPPQRLSEYQQMHFLSEDAMQIFVGTPFSSLDAAEKNEIIAAANLSEEDLDKSLLDIVGILWGINKTGYAANITQNFFNNLLANSTNYSLLIEDYSSLGNVSVIYNSSARTANRRIVSASSRVVSGYKENTPNTGYVAKAYILGATKKTQSYVYFGGYEGNGEITKVLVLPNGTESISEAYMELDTQSNFSLYINGLPAGTYTVGERLPLRAKNWTIDPSYSSYFVNGSNNVTLSFPDINSAYIGGGFFRVTYNTSITDTNNLGASPDGNVTDYYYFPGIDGLINLYSSFYVPGTLKSLGIRLNYVSNYTVYLMIGNVSVYENNTNAPQTIYLNNTYLSSILNYSTFSQTMPIRFGTKNITGSSEGSDVVLITDVSGSMNECNVAATSGTDCNAGTSGIQRRKIDVAKESDIDFVNTVLETDEQKVGIISYDSTTRTSQTVSLTDNNSTLIAMINTYAPGSGTCIACGIKSSMDMLVATLNITRLVANQSNWHYNDSYLSAEPPLDPEGRNWTHMNYSFESLWKTGNAVFGNGTHSIPVTTNILGGSSIEHPDLWDMDADKATHEIDFTSGMNSTANTFGIGAGDDGWDWGAQYNYDNGDNTYLGELDGKLVFSTLSGSPLRNRCSNYDCSGGYGIQINITQEQYDLLSSDGVARVSLDYEWAEAPSSTFESTDDVWIKGRWTSPTTGAHNLGTEMSSSGSDSTPEIAVGNDPTDSISGHFSQNITGWIEGPGTYYLDFGGKLRASYYDESGNFSFDNILIEISNTTDAVYFRKNFTVSNVSAIGKGLVRMLSGDYAEAYLNNVLVFNNSGAEGVGWDANIINRRNFRQGNNIIAVKLSTKGGLSRFGLELVALNDSRNKAMLVMSDGEANVQLSPASAPVTSAQIILSNSFTSPESDAINRSCTAYENYGIISHAVGFGSDAINKTLQGIADCGHGNFYSSNNAEDLKQIYKDIANAIVAYTTQAAEISGDTSIGKLYPDSFIEYNYTPDVDLNYGDISLIFESNTFGNTSGNASIESPKNGSYNISSNMLVTDVKATSYSSDYWTSTLEAKNESGYYWKTAFNLSAFGSVYSSLGDPYIINIPVSFITPGELNYARINTARNITELAGGSPDNRVIYSVRVKGGVDYGNTFNTSDEAKADANARLASYLETFGISAMDIRNDTIDMGKIPWMWGPAIMTLEVWK